MTIQPIIDAILETINECGPSGAPGGPIYLAMQHIGMDFHTFDLIMTTLVNEKKIIKKGQCYFPV